MASTTNRWTLQLLQVCHYVYYCKNACFQHEKDARGAWKICFFVYGNILGTIPVKQREKRRSSGYADSSLHSMGSNIATVPCIYILAWLNQGCSKPVIRVTPDGAETLGVKSTIHRRKICFVNLKSAVLSGRSPPVPLHRECAFEEHLISMSACA